MCINRKNKIQRLVLLLKPKLILNHVINQPVTTMVNKIYFILLTATFELLIIFEDRIAPFLKDLTIEDILNLKFKHKKFIKESAKDNNR